MTGAEVLLRTLVNNGVSVCFMNPGTSEMQFVSALDRVEGMRGVLCLYEGVCSGAADGYARMTGRPASTLLHLGPGLANALSNFHNARKARSPIVNLVGEHATHHMAYDAPLTADIEAFARTVSGWVRTVERVEETGRDACDAVNAAMRGAGQVATLIIPADFTWADAGSTGGPVLPPPVRSIPQPETLAGVVRLLQSGEPAALLLGGRAIRRAPLAGAARIAAHTGARVLLNRYAGRFERGRGIFNAPRVPYFPEQAEALLGGLKHMILIEAHPPVSFFGYPGRRSGMAPEECVFHTLAADSEDGATVLAQLAEACGARRDVPSEIVPLPELPMPITPLTPDGIGRVLAHYLPAGAIISDEMVSASEFISVHLNAAAAHDILPVTGGSIGQGLPVAVGAAVACPDRKVVALEADGSGMYTLQSLWTMARESLDVTVIVLANRRYRILDVEMQRTGSGMPGPRADAMLDLRRPDLDWVKLAEAQGVAGSSAATVGEFIAQFRDAMDQRGPRLIEALIP